MIIKKATPYMIRNDGTVFECEDRHPYVLKDVNFPMAMNMEAILSNSGRDIIWFASHTKNKNLIELIRKSLQSVANIFGDNSEIDIDLYSALGFDETDFFSWEPIFREFSVRPKSCYISNYAVKECISFWKDLNFETNQEFLRMRTSDLYRGGDSRSAYFRISSFGFNWFAIIWDICYRLSYWVEDVTIVADEQAGKDVGKRFYVLQGKSVDHMPIDEFLTTSGNPVVESEMSSTARDLYHGKTLMETFTDRGLHNQEIFEVWRKYFTRLQFTEEKNVK